VRENRSEGARSVLSGATSSQRDFMQLADWPRRWMFA